MHEKKTFGDALEALKQGKRVYRLGWNGKGMFLWLLWRENRAMIVPGMDYTLPALPVICMKTADDKALTGWLASQADMLAEDWVIMD